MTLEKQEELINNIVKKDPDFTIKDYLELVDELDIIEKSTATPTGKVIITDFVKSRTVCS